MSAEVARRYRFAPAGKPGLFGSIPPAQIAVAATGAVAAWLLTLARVFPPVAAVPGLVGVVIAFKRVDGHPLYQVIPLGVRWWWHQHRHGGRWCRAVPLLGAADHVPVELPPAMAGLELLDVPDPDGRPRAVVHDHYAGTVSAVMAVSGDGQFSLVDPLEQDRRVALWGDAIAGFCRERGAVRRLVWHERTAAGTHQPEPAPAADGRAASDYRALLRAVSPTLITHEIHLVVTVAIDAVATRHHRDRLAGAVEVLFEETRLFTSRLDTAGLTATAVLSPVEVTHTIRTRSDPHAGAVLETLSRSLASLAGRAAADYGPMAIAEEWRHVQVNGAVHRSFWVRGWPRLDVPAGWMDGLFTHTTGTRTVTVVFEPIPPTVAARAAERDAVRLEASEDSRTRRGFRTRAGDRRARHDVEAREHELTAGYGDVAYAGFVTITAPTPDLLADLAADTEQAAAHTGVLLDPLDGRHDAGWVASLPLGRSVADQRHVA